MTYLGWLYQWGAPLTLIGEDADQMNTAQRELVRIGIDDLSGAAVGEIGTLVGDGTLRAYAVSDFAGLATATRDRTVVVLDTRQSGEYRDGHIAGAVNISLHELAHRLGEVPVGEVWVHSASGYRSSIAASLLDRSDRNVVFVDDDYENAASAGLPQTTTH